MVRAGDRARHIGGDRAVERPHVLLPDPITLLSGSRLRHSAGAASLPACIALPDAPPRCAGWSEVTNAEPGQGALHAVHKPRAFLDQALALPIGPLGVLFVNRRNARHAAVAPFPTQSSYERPLQQFSVEPVRLCPAMLPRHGDTRGMDHMRLNPTSHKPARQPETVAAGFEG